METAAKYELQIKELYLCYFLFYDYVRKYFSEKLAEVLGGNGA